MQLNRRAAIESPHADELVVIALGPNAQHLVTKCTTNLIVVHEVPRAPSDLSSNRLWATCEKKKRSCCTFFARPAKSRMLSQYLPGDRGATSAHAKKLKKYV